MRGYDHDHALDSGFRPRADRGDRVDQDLLGRAAVAGRTDVLGPEGLLGLQRTVGNTGTTSLMAEERSPVVDVVNSGGGAPLPTDTRADMEARFGHDFGDVRVHTDAAAHESAKSVNAHAYTVGPSIVFQRGNYDPTTASGRHMLAHELTHVVQQRSGPVDGTDVGNGVRVSDPSDRFEREAVTTADRLMSGPAPSSSPGAGPNLQRHGDDSAHDDSSAQRQEAVPEEDEEAIAQTFVQRLDEEEATE